MPNSITTDRLLIKELTLDDAAFILELVNTPGWLQFIGDRGVHTLADAKRYISDGPMHSYRINKFGLYLVEEKESKMPIGMCGLLKRDTLNDIDLGYALLPQFAGKGYAYEAASAMIEHARTALQVKRVVAITKPENTRSIQLLTKLGFHFENLIAGTNAAETLNLFGCSL